MNVEYSRKFIESLLLVFIFNIHGLKVLFCLFTGGKLDDTNDKKGKTAAKSVMKSDVKSPVDNDIPAKDSQQIDRRDSSRDGGATRIRSQIVKVPNNRPVGNVTSAAEKPADVEEQNSKRLKVVRKVAVKPSIASDQKTLSESKERKSIEIYKPPVSGKTYIHGCCFFISILCNSMQSYAILFSFLYSFINSCIISIIS